MAAKGTLIGLPIAELTAIRDAMSAGIVAAMARGTSYTIAGRSFTFPGLSEAGAMAQEANYAIGLINGSQSRIVRANFNDGMGRDSQ